MPLPLLVGMVSHSVRSGDWTHPTGRTAFERSVRRPLNELCAAGTVEPLLIVVDGLDEAGTTQNALAELIRHFLQPEARVRVCLEPTTEAERSSP